jgi:hypothetical protein
MIRAKLTCGSSAANIVAMSNPKGNSSDGTGSGYAQGGWHAVRAGWMRILGAGGGAAAMLAMTGCVTVNAPDKAIVIELNINIKQEVVYRLAADAGKTIDTNKDIF